MLELSRVSAGYDDVQILDSIDMTVRDGEMVGLLGANNAGKTTLINCISRIVPSLGGHIGFDGRDITSLRTDQVVELGVIQVPEGRLLFPQMTVRENLLLGGMNRRARGKRKTGMERILSLFPRLAERLDQLAGTMSGGEQQMLAIGRGLMAEPRVLMLDEPSLGVAPLFVKAIFAALRLLNEQGLTVLVVEQNLKLTLQYAQRCYVLERGRIVISGSSAEVRDHPGTRKAYLGL
jgi:branched-chain amino acid transport system ATP-binding protein